MGLLKKFRKGVRVVCRKGPRVVAGAAMGGFLGSKIGIAALGTAIPGTFPLAIAGGYFAKRLKKK